MNEALLRDLFDGTSDLIQRVAPDGRVLLVNRAWQTALGYSEDEVARLNLFDLVHPDSRKHCTAIWERLLLGQDVGLVEASFVTKSGRRIDLEGNVSFQFAGDRPIASRGIFRDVTGRRQAAAELAGAKGRLELALAAAVTSIWDSDIVASRVAFDAGWRRMLGYSPEPVEMSLRKALAMVHPEDRERALSTIRATISGATDSYQVEQRVHTAAGGWVWVLSRGRAVERDASGLATRLIGTNTDVSARKEAELALVRKEAELRAAHERLDLALEASATSTWFSDIVANRVTLDPRWSALLGLGTAPLTVTPRALLATVHPDDRQAAMRAARSSVEGRADNYQVEHRVRTAAGDWIWILSRGRVVARDGAGRATRLIGTNTDITARMAAESVRRELFRELHRRAIGLEAANRELEAFSYSVSHDLRSPLHGIEGWSQALEEDCAPQLDEHGRGLIGRVREEVARMNRLIEAMLGLARWSQIELNRGPVDLGAVARGIAQRLRASAPGRVVDFRIADCDPVSADPRLVEALMQNLLENAWKFTARRPVACIAFGQTDTPRGRAYFVRDNGAGFNPQQSDRLFVPFQRLHKAADFPGTGVGLATVRRIARRQGGEAWAESVPQEGATFYFTLGIADPDL